MELLAVIGAVAFLSTMAAPAFTQLLIGSKFEQSLVQASGALERAREYAVSNRAYAYVALTGADENGQITLATFGANDASAGVPNLVTAGDYEVATVGASPGSLRLLDRLIHLEACLAEDAIPEGSALNTAPALNTLAVPFLRADSGLKFSYVNGEGKRFEFTRAIQFTPEGDARVSPVIPDAVQLVLVPTKGDPAMPHRDPANAAAIRIAGLTGQIKVHRP